ncbi:AlpA family transcriptional regulator [Gemmobacter sp. 24YEA27]|uniref:helix-turn-helix transcriptional regulator n=1 Tax=Gemmobacter sp. 24YEA27 TaxID=3040672 RepID=UPI0024B3977C|nr:AlpA family transcriptional regulator [Gemmobacter sp. 24YEA27]
MLEKHHRMPAVVEATGLSRTTLYEMMKEGTFPKPVKLSSRAIAWPESVLKTWMEERANLSA